jgi:hypothetical protein
LVLVSFSACVGLRSYRTAPPYRPVEEFQDKDGNPVRVGFVELDDHGLYWTDRGPRHVHDDAARGALQRHALLDHADPDVVNGHSDVWNPVWVNMLIGMMESLGPERRR